MQPKSLRQRILQSLGSPVSTTDAELATALRSIADDEVPLIDAVIFRMAAERIEATTGDVVERRVAEVLAAAKAKGYDEPEVYQSYSAGRYSGAWSVGLQLKRYSNMEYHYGETIGQAAAKALAWLSVQPAQWTDADVARTLGIETAEAA